MTVFKKNGGSGRARTYDLVLLRQQKKIADPRISKRTYNTRSNQLSYTAILVSNATTRAELFGRSLVCLNEQG